MQKHLFSKAIKASIINCSLLKAIKPGHRITIFLITRGVSRQMRIVSHTGLVLKVKKNQLSSTLVIKKTIYNYGFLVVLNVNSLNLVRFFIH